MNIIPLFVLLPINRIEFQEMKLKELKNGRLALRLAAVFWGNRGRVLGFSGGFVSLGKQQTVFFFLRRILRRPLTWSV